MTFFQLPLIEKMAKAIHDADTEMNIKEISTIDLTDVAKKAGMTMHQYMQANPETVFVVDHGWITVTYNELPNGNNRYVITH